MNLLRYLAASLACLIVLASRGWSQPANDSFANAIVLSGTTIATTGSNAGATKEPGEPDHAGNAGGNSVWWTWTAPASGGVTLDTSGSSFDTLLAVYIGGSVSNLNLIASNDNHGSNLTSLVSFNVLSNQTYQIAVDGAAGSTRNITLALTFKLGEFQISSVPRKDFWVPDDAVETLVQTNGTLYFGGEFLNLAPNTHGSAMFDAVTGFADPTFPGIDGVLLAALPDGAGGWYLGGQFSSVGGVSRRNIARVLADNTIDANFHPVVEGDGVVKLALSATTLYVGGNFTSVGGQARASLAAIDRSTGEVTPWDPKPSVQTNSQFVAAVFGLAVADNTLYVGGLFDAIGGQPRGSIAAFDLASGDVTPWNASVVGDVAGPGQVFCFDVSGSVVYVGGHFTSISGQVRTNLAALDRTTGQVTAWNPNASWQHLSLNPLPSVRQITVFCNTVYIAGDFMEISRHSHEQIAALDPITALPRPWNPAPYGLRAHVAGFAISGNTVYVGGRFVAIGYIGNPQSPYHTNLAAVDITTGFATAWQPEADTEIQQVVVAGSKVLAGGILSGRTVGRSRAAALNMRTGKPLAWNPGAGHRVYALAYASNAIYLGGIFLAMNCVPTSDLSCSGGQPRSGLAAVDATTGAVLPWQADVDIINSLSAPTFVTSLAIANNTLYVAGSFDRIEGKRHVGLAAVDANTGTVLAWSPNCSGTNHSIAVVSNTVYVGGDFSSSSGPNIGGAARSLFAAIDGTTGAATPWNPNAQGVGLRGFSIVPAGGTIYVGGQFGSVGGQPRTGLAALDSTSALASSWNPNPVGPASAPGSLVKALALSGSTLYVGGTFATIGGQQHNRFAAIDAITGLAKDWNVDATSVFESTDIVYALAASSDSVVVGGNFTTIGGSHQPNLAAFPPIGSPVITEQPVGANLPIGQAIRLRSSAIGHPPLVYQWQFNGTNIDGATNTSLEILNAQVADSGDYALVVTNFLGLINSKPASINIFEPVVIVSQPQSQSIPAGTKLVLTVEASGHPAPLYQWRLNGVNIPGAVGSTMTISNAQPQDGGSYSVIVINGAGAIISSNAQVIVDAPLVGFTDNFADRITANAPSGVGHGSNVFATVETGEPNHAGQPGGKSVWFSWRAPANGIAVFRTRGSTFDTLLAVYTNLTASGTNLLVADDDQGGFLTSIVSFNALAGTEYQIAIDGFARASGNIVLSWSLQAGTNTIPILLSQPQSRSVSLADSYTFGIVVVGAALRYQWFHNCMAIAGATNASLSLANIQTGDVGLYYVQVTGTGGTVQSQPAVLEIGLQPETVSHDKLEDLFFQPGPIASASKGPLAATMGSGSGFISVSMGTIDSQILNNTGATTQDGEPAPCGVIGGASKWFGLHPAADGVMQIDTIGSSYDTVLAVYTGTNSIFTLKTVACDNNGAPDTIRSLVRFAARAGTNYAVAVDGVNGAQGQINLNWKLGLPPVTHYMFSNQTVLLGGSTVLTVSASSPTPDVSYQWLLNNTRLAGATNASLLLNNLRPSQSGTYAVSVRNFAGAVTNTVAVVDVTVPIHLGSGLFRAGSGWQFQLTAQSDQSFLLQRTTNFLDWLSIYTNGAGTSSLIFSDPDTTNHPRGFYRVIPWP